MGAPRKYPDELRERAIRMAVDLRRDPATKTGALKRVAKQLGINPETLRNWVIQVEVDNGDRPGTTTDDATRLAELERENREPRRTNEIRRRASAFFAAELDRPSRWGLTSYQVSLAWLLSRPAVASVIIGPESSHELRANASAAEVHLDEAQLDQLSALAEEPPVFHHRAGDGPAPIPQPVTD